VADVGSGTGKLSHEFLQAGFEVFAVEPNEAMRAATQHQTPPGRFHNLAGTAEALPLPDHCVQLLVAGQAFHWFDQEKCKPEFKRVLQPGGGLMILWNNRRTASSRFLQEYEDMLVQHCPDYANVGNQHYDPDEIHRFFDGQHESACLRYQQHHDETALLGRVFSSSYTPAAGPERQALEAATRELFARHAVDGRVCFDYDTEIFYGRFA